MRNVPVSDSVANIVKREVEARNKKLRPGQRKYTQQVLIEEIILFWKENKK